VERDDESGHSRHPVDRLHWRNEVGFGGFSWKRAVGISAAKSRLSRRIGIPLTKSGRQRKLGKLVSGGGCLFALAFTVAIPVILVALVTTLF
jgi:hypothetical protein